ncbi:MAG: 50S ribosomal protein L25 [Lentisphaerae bacterium]|nr:50S ribosomal protein L25 [Lentisphaerota bacterium]
MVQKIETIQLSASRRNRCGSRVVRRLRQEGWLPGILYNAQGRSQPIQLQRHAFELLIRHRAGENLIMDLTLDGEAPQKVLLKDTQRDHIHDNLMHVDFLEISLTRKLRVPVAIRLTGEPFGVTQEGGVLEHLLRSVEVECLPGDLVKELALDVSALKIGDSLFVRDLKVDPKKLTILTAADIAVAAVLMPHIEEEVKPEEAAAEGAAQPEVIGEVKEGEAAADETKEGKAPTPPAAGKETAPKAEKGKEAKGKGREKE